MGVMKLFSSSSYDSNQQPNPNPKNYQILSSAVIGSFLVLRIKYPDCTNYEGMKILVFENTTEEDLRKQGSIDPHFSQNPNYVSPIARFKPDDEGWEMALEFVWIMRSLRSSQRVKNELR